MSQTKHECPACKLAVHDVIIPDEGQTYMGICPRCTNGLTFINGEFKNFDIDLWLRGTRLDKSVALPIYTALLKARTSPAHEQYLVEIAPANQQKANGLIDELDEYCYMGAFILLGTIASILQRMPEGVATLMIGNLQDRVTEHWENEKKPTSERPN